MKNKYTLLAGIFMLMISNACIRDNQTPLQPRGIMQVEIMNDGIARSTRAGDEWISTIRFIVFTDLDSSPRAEINRLYVANELDISPAVGDIPSKARIVLEVERKESGSNEKLVVTIVNEPALMETVLDGITTPAELTDLELEMSHFVAADHLSLKEDVLIPMTGALWTNRMFRSGEEASMPGHVLTMEVQRAVARVDVYLKKGTDVDPGLKMVDGSTITLDNTYSKSLFIRHTEGNKTLGGIQTVDSEDFIEKSWSLDTDEQVISETVPVCVFYTPERNCSLDRLSLTLDIKTSEGATRSGSLDIETAFDVNDVETPVDIIRRNNIYRVIATIGTNGITAKVRCWNDQNINTEL